MYALCVPIFLFGVERAKLIEKRYPLKFKFLQAIDLILQLWGRLWISHYLGVDKSLSTG